jgi:hypothetical protein
VIRGRRALARAAVTVGVVLAAGAAPAAHAAASLDLGFSDSALAGAAPERDAALQRAAGAGAGIVRIDIGWVAPDTATRPAPFDARDPADPSYAFGAADAAIRGATAHGLRILATFTGAPRWAEGRGRPADATPGSWRPDPQALQDYGTALARRYSGAFPDPANPGRTLPRVAAFQVWNEPNLAKYLAPQWSGGRMEAPARYRRMLRAFYAGVRAGGSDALVVTAGTAPFGDPGAGGARIMPARFVRSLLCLHEDGAGRLRSLNCRDPARFDVLAHHPYSVGSPARRALNDDDVSIPDIGKLTRLLRAAERGGGALPRERHQVWVTEVSYDSSPPDPDGVPLATHARFLAQTLLELWSQGVGAVFWFQVADQAPQPSYAATNQSGVYFRDGRPKPALRAFRFPLAARAEGSVLAVWGRAPVAGDVRIERRTTAGWTMVRTLPAASGSTFQARIPRRGTKALRARVGGLSSLAWQTG